MPAASFPMPENTLLPVANRTQSFWLSERDPILDKARTTTNMPQTADVVVVGGGLTGVLTAYNILKKASPGLPPSVVLVEASDFCNGATARNGGHCKPMTYFGYEQDRALRGPAAANALLEFEEAQLAQYIALVEAEPDIDCDLHVTRACDVFFDAKEAESARRSFLLRKEDHPRAVEAGDVREITDRAELERVSGMKGGYWGATYPAGHLWPYKLTCGLTHAALRCGLNLQTNTPVLSVTKNSSSLLPWTVMTGRGMVSASTVVIATNAYTAGILPDFKDKIVPVRGTACSITPSRSHLPGGLPGKLTYSYGLRFGAGQSDYMIPRQGRGRIPGRGDQSYILGGAKGLFQHTPELWYNTIRDDEQFAGAREYFEDYASKHFVGWDASSGSLDFLWTGILGYSSDLLPYIGEHPTQEGLFVLAGFTGHGMPRIPACAEAIALLVSSRLTSADRRTPPSAVAAFRMAIPAPYHLTAKRLASKVNLIKTMLGSKAADKIENKAIEEPGDLTTEVAIRAKL